MQTLDEEEALIPKTDPRREQIAKDRAAILPQYQALIKQIATGQAPSAAPIGTKKAAPEVGTIVRGFRFKGGDPSKKESWEKVQ